MLSLGRVIVSVSEVMRTCHDVLLNGRKRARNENLLDVIDFDSEMGTLEPENSETKRRNVEEGSELIASQANTENLNRLSGWLCNEEITAIGIYGMGGIGKTALGKQLYDKHLELYAADIALVSVGMKFSVEHLQLNIAKAFGLDLRDEKDVNRRAAVLNAYLCKSAKRVIIIDDLWGNFRREIVGIPKHCKLILISRSMDVCRVMGCQKLIKVEPLPEEDAWLLFSCSLGSEVLDTEEITRMAKHLCRECAGVPLAINSFAKSMRGVDDAFRWSSTLKSLNNDPVGLTALEKIITVLKHSYDTLSVPKLKSCFLYCAVYPKGYAISREELIRLWIGEMLIDDVLSLRAQYDKGHTIVNKLLNCCLLEICGDNSRVKMNGLVRIMALSLSKGSFMVTDEMPEIQDTELEGRNALRLISLINSSLQITSDAPLSCQNLSSLLLQHNPLQALPDSFFLKLHALHILNLSDTPIRRLPSSISFLDELRVLDVSWCVNLKKVPPLGNLQKLRILDISRTSIEQVPSCIVILKMLTELNISAISELSEYPSGMLSSLSRLRRLACDAVGIVDELQRLDSLEILDARFRNLADFSSYVRSQHWRSLESYHLQVGCDMGVTVAYTKRVSLLNCTVISQCVADIVLPDDIRELYVDGCREFRCLSDVMNPVDAVFGTNCYQTLEKCTIRRCPDIEKLFTAACMRKLQQIAIIDVQDCGQLKELIAEEFGVKNEVIELPHLHRISVTRLPLLNCIYKGQLICGSLQSLSLEGCPKLNCLPFNADDGEKTCPSTLLRIEDKKIGGSYWNRANLNIKLC